MAEHFKLVINPKVTQIVTFTGVDEDFAQIYGDTLAYARMLAGDDSEGNESEREPVPKSIYEQTYFPEAKPATMEYVFAPFVGPPTLEEIQDNIERAKKYAEERQKSLEKKERAKERANKNLQELQKLKDDPNTYEGKYARYNYKKRIKERAANFRAYAFINFAKNTTQFVTLTFDSKLVPNANDLDTAHECFRKFIKRIQSKFSDFRYLAVFCRQGEITNQSPMPFDFDYNTSDKRLNEFVKQHKTLSKQNTGNWHYHMLCNFDGSVTSKEIHDIWKYGITHSVLLTSGDELYTRISYCISNMSKVAYQDLRNEKGYLRSHRLQNHIVLRSWNNNESEQAYKLLQEILQSSQNKPTPRNSIMLQKGESFFTRLGSSDGEPYEVKIDDVQINYLYSPKGFPELFKPPLVAKRK